MDTYIKLHGNTLLLGGAFITLFTVMSLITDMVELTKSSVPLFVILYLINVAKTLLYANILAFHLFLDTPTQRLIQCWVLVIILDLLAMIFVILLLAVVLSLPFFNGTIVLTVYLIVFNFPMIVLLLIEVLIYRVCDGFLLEKCRRDSDRYEPIE